jgi:pimeloyl-ACP methyl ester carboxylesterase
MKRHPRWFSLFGVLALLIGMTAGSPAFAQDQDAGPRPRPEGSSELGDRLCPVAGPTGEVEGDTYYCGLLYVPENYDKPEDGMIQITYAVLKSKSLSPLPDPIVYLEGGPGGSAIADLDMYATIFAELRQTRDIILFDQRGTKYSTRLDCDPFLLMLNYLIDTDPEVAANFQDIVEATDETLMSGTVAQLYMGPCEEGLTDAGYDLTQYNSVNSVKDLFTLTEALGYDEVNLYGISYGTRLALTAMREHPDGIRSVVLDSTYPPQIDNLENMSNLLDEVLSGLVKTCQADTECNTNFPDFETELKAVIKNAAKDPDLLDAVQTVLSYINQNPAVGNYIPLMIHELANGDTTTLQAIVDGDVPAEPAPEDVPGQQDDMLLEAQQLQESAEQLFQQAALEAQANRPGAQWMDDVATAMKPLSEDDTTLAAIAMLLTVLQSPVPDVDWLKAFVTEYLPEKSQDKLIDELDDLSAEELQYVYDLITDTSDQLTDSGGTTDGMYFSVECNEEVHFNDLDVAAQIADDLEFPEFGASGLAAANQIAAVCSVWPSGTSDEIETEPVESDIPTLVLSGDYDVQTPSSWNALAMEGLSNAELIEFPQSGHGVIAFSACASNVATSFVSEPRTDLNADCTENLEPNFVTQEEFDATVDTADDDTASPATPEDDGSQVGPRG